MRCIAKRFLAFAVLLSAVSALSADEWEITRPAIQFDRCEFAPMLSPTEPDIVGRVMKAGLLQGYTQGQPWNPVTGWVEYDVEVPKNGWYEFFVPGELYHMEYFVDGQLVMGSTCGGKIGNLWLDAGKHVFRLQRWNWTGFQGALEKWTLRAAGQELGKNLRLLIPDGRTIVRAGEDVKLVIQGGGRADAAQITARLIDTATKRVVARKQVNIPADPKAVEVPAPLACPGEGVFELSLAQGDQPIQGVGPLQIVAADTQAPTHGGELKKVLLSEIDCVATAPQYVGEGGSKVVDGAPGKYRESGTTGFLFAQHHGQDSSWFAYTFAVPEAGKPYILEADCPDDAFRTFAIAIREAAPDAYPVAGGMDTGGCYALSGKMQTQSLLFWPRTTDLRVVFVTAHNGRPGAAAAKVRVYRVDGEIPVMNVPVTGGRTFANWYEEGDNYLAMYGGDRSVTGMIRGADRWARVTAYMGGNVLVPTISVYQMSMYPSAYNRSHCFSGTFDHVRVIALKCEKYGLGLIGEFHPECRDLDHLGDPAFTKIPRSNYMTDKDGQTKDKIDFSPKFHPLDPVNQDWYVGMVGEFVDRYRDSPALRGVCLRVMGWQNPALNNFHSLDWGYDDLTVDLFERETGLSTGVKSDDPKRFQARYAWLMANAKDQWIAWRCRQIAALYTKLRDRVRQARPDLKIYSDVCDRPDMGLEAGIDPQLLGAIDGVVVINSRAPYGRQAYTYEGPLADHRRRDNLMDPERLLAMRSRSGEAAFMFYSCYFEGTEVVVTPESLGFPKGTKRTWMSAVVNPTGRLYLERYAVALAQTDVTYFADGGNAYVIGQPIQQEFMREYRNLPPVAFTSRPDARDPVAVRELARKEDFLFYAVNGERYPVQVTIALKGKGPVKRLATGEEVALKDGRLAFELKAYQLLTFTAPVGTEITQVVTRIPSEDKTYIESLVNAVAALNNDVQAGTIPLDDEGRKLLAKTVDEARICMKEGRYGRARTMMSHSQLAEKVYAKTLVFPPSLTYLADPQLLNAIRAKGLVKPHDAVLDLKLEQIAEGKTPVAGKRDALQAFIEGGCEVQDGRNGGKALHFDGKSGRVVVKGGDWASKNLSVSMWVNPENVGGRRGLFARTGYETYFWNGSVAVEGGDKSGRTTCRTGDGLCNCNTWYHLVIIYESGKAITLYINGVETRKVAFPQALDVGAGEFVLGWNGWGGTQNDPSPGWFAGKISQLRVFDRVLAPDEVLAEWAGKD